MGEAKRRQMRMVELSAKEVERLVEERGLQCAWNGCKEFYRGEMPPDWRCLLLFWAPGAVTSIKEISRYRKWDRDAVLCPKHADQLHNHLLMDIGQRLDDTAGNA